MQHVWGQKRCKHDFGVESCGKSLGKPRGRWDNDIKMYLQMGKPGLNLSVSEQRQLPGSCECGNEPSISVNFVEFLDCLRTGQILKKDSAAWFQYERVFKQYIFFSNLNPYREVQIFSDILIFNIIPTILTHVFFQRNVIFFRKPATSAKYSSFSPTY